jgi:hypothetical protein
VRTFSIIEAEGLGELPSPIDGPDRSAGGFPRWLAAAAAALLLVIAGGGAWWLYFDHQRGDAAIASATQSAAEKHAADEAAARAAAERQKAAAVPVVAAAPADPPRAVPATPETPSPTNDSANEGVYSGPICFAGTRTLPASCFPVEATLQHGSISGQWPGRDPAVTMHLAGDVSASGHVTIHMHGEKADGTRLAVVDFSGTLRDGLLDATGAFANGRTATLNWRKSEEGHSSATPVATAAPPTIEAKLPTPARADAPPTLAAKPPPPATPASLRTANPEGVYAGPVCFGPGPADPARCFRAQATVQQGRISGQWPGRDRGVTMYLEGDVLPSGVVSIHLHAENPNGSRRATINLTGTLHDGKLDATGAFLNGRSASLNWSKN